MIFLSAQPDSIIFFWQLEVFLESIKDFGYSKNQIHILIGFNPYEGASPISREFAKENSSRASIFFYPDLRTDKTYVSSIRPQIIKQHYATNPWLTAETIFYHDSDIVFTRKMDFSSMEKGATWYVSDTRGYLNASYIKRCGEIILNEMCDIVGVSRTLIEEMDEEAGGAQYIIKNVDYSFWNKVEKDSEKLLKHLMESKERYANDFAQRTNKPATDYKPIQAWCSDMWAVLWNGYYYGHQVKIHSEMNFIWPSDQKANWDSLHIYHDAGVSKEFSLSHFDKSRHLSSFPYFFNNAYANNESCTSHYVALIEEVGKKKKYDLKDTTILIPVRIDSQDRLNNISAIIKYLNKYFDTTIVILEVDAEKKINPEVFGINVKYIFEKDDNEVFKHTECNNLLVGFCESPIMAIYDTDVIISPDQLYQAVLSIRYGEADIVSPYDGDFMDVSEDIRDLFFETTDIKLLNSNKSEFSYLARHSWGGAILANKQEFKKIGLDNTNLVGYGPEDYERVKRAEILGCKVKRIKGPLFHLKHERKINSYYINTDTEIANKIEFLKVCNMSRSELETYINTWTCLQ